MIAQCILLGVEVHIKNTETRSSSTDCTVYGFTSFSSAKKKKVSVGKVLASCFGIRPQVYILEVVTAKYELKNRWTKY